MSNVYVHFSQISFPARYSVVNFQLESHSLRFREVITTTLPDGTQTGYGFRFLLPHNAILLHHIGSLVPGHLPSPHFPYLSIQGIFDLLPVLEPVCPLDWLIPKIIPSFLYHLTQRIRFPDPVPSAVVLVNCTLPKVHFRLITI